MIDFDDPGDWNRPELHQAAQKLSGQSFKAALMMLDRHPMAYAVKFTDQGGVDWEALAQLTESNSPSSGQRDMFAVAGWMAAVDLPAFRPGVWALRRDLVRENWFLVQIAMDQA